MLSLLTSLKNKIIKPKPPLNVILLIEESCNLRCIQCDIWKNRVIAKIEMTTEQRIEAIVKIKKWLGPYTLNIFCGEPLIHPQIYDLIRGASDNGIKTIITTNGTSLTKTSQKKLIDAGLSGLIVSIDGSSKTHDSIRGVKGTHKRSTKHLKEMLQMKNRPKIVVETLIMKNNINELGDMVRWAKKIKADGIMFQPITSKYGFGSDQYDEQWHNSPDSLMPKQKDSSVAMSEIIKLKSMGFPILNTNRHLDQSSQYLKNPKLFLNKKSKISVQPNFSLDQHGNIYFDSFTNSLGNINNQINLSNLWTNSKIHEITQQPQPHVDENKILLCNSLSLTKMLEIN